MHKAVERDLHGLFYFPVSRGGTYDIRRKRRGAEPLLHLLDQSVEDTELFALTSRVKRVGDAPYLSRVSFRVTVPSVVTSL